ncbi:isoaspartyl peptidase [Candidatus Photodesmus katoptron]|uniref:isoaspartyl peptidase/L-asparaginase family protein n=1 Tax=Candidatus Photodesmus anomalopis TaxID=28176 RepID=UPI0004D8D7BC|nr:isoaspartyl peptidase/L-asparaginase [Candidatus Photodesmus katoptron]KEY90138.1 isoaspartyl peptidase [Candidatus Photodesmus katoptron]
MVKPFSIAIHGGAGAFQRKQMKKEIELSIKKDLERSVLAGHSILKKSGDALDAAVEAVRILEDSPKFNAGRGSVFNNKEIIEMDASVMHGKKMTAGAIAGVRHIKNPIMLARDVMKKSKHVLLVGEGAEEFAFEHNHQYIKQDYFYTTIQYNRLIYMKKRDLFELSDPEYLNNKYGTVGAVALDQQGNLASATSTGGITNKRYGRVSDSALIGSGTVAENGNVAVSTTGIGEIFIRKMVASDVAARMRYLEEDIITASESVIQGDLKSIGGEGGLIAIDAYGNICFSMNTSGMYRASIDINGNLIIKIYSDD